ncbi:hypothetical protein V2J09_019988 [Rumex salicifolius]
MSSVCSSLRLWIQPWTNRNGSFVFLHSRRSPTFLSVRISSSFMDDSSSLSYDPSEELFGLGVDLSQRDSSSSNGGEPRSWFGPNGQYIRELPCPSCRGRGYTPCSKCGIERSRLDCAECNGKGMITCSQCSGDCVIWQESIDEKPWENARSSSPLKVKEDDEVDNLDLQLEVRKKSKRIYHSTSPEVGRKISRSLKSLNARTGLFSKRMKIIHRDPALHAQRVAAIKKAKGTDASRKRASEVMKAYFSDPENRRKRSLIMQVLQWTCSLCGEKGHNKRSCWKLKAKSSKRKVQRRCKCSICGKYGHNKRTCPQPQKLNLINTNGDAISIVKNGLKKSKVGQIHHCKLCGRADHNKRTCPRVKRRCSLCGRHGHYSKTCSISLVLNKISDKHIISLNSIKLVKDV